MSASTRASRASSCVTPLKPESQRRPLRLGLKALAEYAPTVPLRRLAKIGALGIRGAALLAHGLRTCARTAHGPESLVRQYLVSAATSVAVMPRMGSSYGEPRCYANHVDDHGTIEQMILEA